MKTSNKLQIAFEDFKQLGGASGNNGEMLRKKHKLTDIAWECIQIMIARNRYIPELEIFYNRKEKSLIALEGNIDAYTIYRFEESLPQHRKGSVEAVLNGDETYRVYENLGLVAKTDIAELNRQVLVLYYEIQESLEQYKLDIKEALTHGDVGFFERYCGGRSKEELIQRLKNDELTKVEIAKVLKLLQL